jgi:hypothetical protein
MQEDAATATAPAPGEHSVSTTGVKTTLGEHGMQLVSEHKPGGIAFEPLDLAYRAKVGRRVETDPSLGHHIGKKLCLYAAHALTRIGADDLSDMGQEERMVHVRKIRVADMMYLGFLRLAGMDDGAISLAGGDACPYCDKLLPVRIKADIRKLNVEAFTELPRVTYAFERPWFLGDEQVKTITMEPPMVGLAIEPLATHDMTVDFLRELAWVAAAVVEVNGKPMRLISQQMSARDKSGNCISDQDWRGINKAWGAIFGGPAAGLAYKHTCGETLALALEWSSGFFGRSAG